jgi:hypothetical protein
LATHYEVLGVAPDADQDAVRRAYTALARTHHPDRQAGRPLADRIVADRKMREVNAAWQVLRDPGRRVAYDASLRGEVPGAGVPRAPRTTTVRAGGAPPPPSGVMVPAGAAPLFRFGPIVLLVLLLGGILVFTAYATSQGSVAPSDGSVPVANQPTPYVKGHCVVLASIRGRTTAVPTSCASPGARLVNDVTDVGRPCAAATAPFDVPGETVRLCLGVDGSLPPS